MSLAVPADLHKRWLSGDHVGDARPTMLVRVRPGHLHRGVYADDGHWQPEWVADDDYMTLPNVASFELEQSFEGNGIAVGSFDIDNTAYVAKAGPGGGYHKIEAGWFSPLRAYRPPGRPGAHLSRRTPNQWDRLLGTVAQVEVQQGYGDAMIRTYNGLLDSTGITPRPDKIKLSSRDFGQILADCDLFGWNIDPKLRDPITFHPLAKVREMERSGDSAKRKTAHTMRKRGVVIADLSDMVTTVLRWAGFPPEAHRVDLTGAPLSESITFAYTDTYATVIQKAVDLTGFQFFMSGPTEEFTRGRPTFRRPRSAIAYPGLVTEVRDDQLLTGLSWQTTDEPRRSIYRVRGGEMPRDRGGRGLGSIRSPAVLSVYRPPWHVDAGTGGNSAARRALADDDARLIRHYIHVEELYKTQHAVDVAAVMTALASALAATTASVEIPGNPAIQLDDVLSVRDEMAGLHTRCWIAQRNETFTQGKETEWKQTLGVSCLDDPYVVEVTRDLHALLTGLPIRGLDR